MKNKITVQAVVSTLICVAAIIPAIMLYDKLPEQMPIHFNASGAADNYAPKALACFGLPGFLAVLNLIVHFSMQNDPKKRNAQGPIFNIGLWGIPVLTLIVPNVVIFKTLGYNLPIEMIIPVIVGVLLVVVGNYLPKAKQNYTVGIKLPWTLNNEDNWNKTHRLGGILFMLGGLAMILMGFLGANMALFLCVMAVIVFGPAVYSYILFKKGM